MKYIVALVTTVVVNCAVAGGLPVKGEILRKQCASNTDLQRKGLTQVCQVEIFQKEGYFFSFEYYSGLVQVYSAKPSGNPADVIGGNESIIGLTLKHVGNAEQGIFEEAANSSAADGLVMMKQELSSPRITYLGGKMFNHIGSLQLTNFHTIERF